MRLKLYIIILQNMQFEPKMQFRPEYTISAIICNLSKKMQFRPKYAIWIDKCLIGRKMSNWSKKFKWVEKF